MRSDGVVVVQWDWQTVKAWLQGKGKLMAELAGTLIEPQQIDGQILLMLNDKDLEELGVSFGLARRMLITNRDGYGKVCLCVQASA